MKVIRYQKADELPEAAAGIGAPTEDGDLGLAVVESGRVAAHAALWWRGAPAGPGGRMGCIGDFEATNDAASGELLEAACVVLAGEGCEMAVGPMNGNTWRSHRFVIEAKTRPRFFLEPWNPPEWPEWWRRAGFGELSRYSSSRFELQAEPSAAGRVEERLAAAGVGIRRLEMDRFEDELKSIHRVSLESFAGNFLYTPMGEDEFVAMYGKVRPLIREDFVCLAESEGVVCGFVFGLPDAEAMKAGRPPDLIVKTLAVRPERRLAGLGSVLVERLQAAAKAAGFAHAIHALQHEVNSSLRITARHGGEVIRRYALFSKSLVR